MLNIERIRQYIIVSYDFGQTWSFLGGYNASNSLMGTVIETATPTKAAKTIPTNIECVKTNPQFVYSTFNVQNNPNGDGYNLRRFDLTTGFWSDISHTGGLNFNWGVPFSPRAFAINPANENDYWAIGNVYEHIMNGITVSSLAPNYSAHYHPDVRFTFFRANGELFIATDGGIYKKGLIGSQIIWIPKSEGLGAAQASSIGITQQPPFYVFSGIWHAGFQIYNPLDGTWRYGALSDGSGARALFLNNSKYFMGDQYGSLRQLNNFNNLTSSFTINNTGFNAQKYKLPSSSENISGRIYAINQNISAPASTTNSSDEIHFSNNDYSSINGFFSGFASGQTSYPKDPNILTFPLNSSEPITIPNRPELLMVKVDNGTEAKLALYSGMSTTTPNPVLEKVINLKAIDPDAQGVQVEFDPRRNNICWIILKGRPLWTSNETNRIIEFNFDTEVRTDITYVLDQVSTQGTPNFPSYVSVKEIKVDRQTGVLYISTSDGIFYLDRENEVWRRYSANVPYFNTYLGIVHCTGEIYASTNYRGIWKTDLIRTNETPTQEWKITQNEVWNKRMNLFCNLIIEPNVTLTVTSDLVVYGFQKIIIKPGGKLLLNGGKITSECGDYWQGIEVWGNSSLSQNNPLNQGQLITMNDAIIENALEAIQVWKPNDWNSMGGIVQCSNTTFRNNRRSCAYMPYHSFNSANTIEYPNKGKFTKCTFVWDNNLIGSSANCGISMFHVNGVTIAGCTFSDNRTGSVASRPNGIGTLDAGFKVLGIDNNPGTILNPNIDHWYDETDFVISRFINLNKGIDAKSSNTTYPVKVDHTKFTNCNIGALVDAIDQAVITRNFFENTPINPQNNQEMYQLVVRNATGYIIEGNSFNNSNVWGALGAGIYDSGSSDNTIYRNKFNGLNEGVYAFGYNSNDQSTIFGSRGLMWKCNEFQNGYIDLIDYQTAYSPTLNGEGVKLLQGLPTSPAGNLFSASITSGGPTLDEHIFHTDLDLMGYFNKSANVPEIPTERFGNVQPISIDPPKNCPSNFNIFSSGIGSMLTNQQKANIVEENRAIEIELEEKIDALASLKLAGNSSSLFVSVRSLNLSNRQTVKNQLFNASPYLSEALLIEVGDVDPSIFPHEWYRDLILENPEVALNADFIDFLNTKRHQMPSSFIETIELSRYISISERGYLESEINALYGQLEQNYTVLICDNLSDTSEITWSEVKNDVDNRNHEFELSELTSIELNKLNLKGAQSLLDSLDNSPQNYSVSRGVTDMSEFSTYNRYVLDLVNSYGYIDSLTEENADDLRDMAVNFQGKAARQARNILCFFLNECDSVLVAYEGRDTPSQKSMFIDENFAQSKALELGIYPNPNKGSFALVVPEG